MADRIKGITIEIDGATTGLKKALSDVTSQSINVQKQLNDVNRLLKFDPSNVTLLAQKQSLLGQAIETTKSKLEQLKNAQAQVDQQFASGKISESQYKAFQREIIDTEARLKSLEGTLKTTSPELQSFGVKAGEASEKLSKIGSNVTGVGKNLTIGVTAPLIGVAAAAIKVGNDFEAQMSRVKAISGATGEEFEALKQQALDLGQSTAFSAGEVAQGQEQLASAGFNTNEIMAAMPGLLNLAASSGEDLATSSDIAASTLRGFGLEASQAGHVADVLAKNAGATNAAVSDTGEAMKYVAPAAKAAGLSFEEVTAAIGIMANSGIKGSQAGTTLRSALTRLASPAKEAKEAMDSIGFSAFDSQGKMLPLKDMIGNLKTSLSGLTDQEKQDKIATIFGQESMSGVLTLIDAGSEGLDDLTKSLKDSDGAAQDMATTMQDNAKSGIEQMFGSLETAGIKIQEALAPAITAVANFVGSLADAFSNLSPTTQGAILAIVGIVAAIGPVLIFIGKIVSAIGILMPLLVGTAESTGLIGIAIAAITGPIGIAIAAITAVVAAITFFWKTNENFRNAVTGIWTSISSKGKEIFGGLAKYFTETLPNAFNTGGFTEVATTIGNSISGIANNITTKGPELLKSGADIIKNLVLGIQTNLPQILASGTQIFTNLITGLSTALPMIVTKMNETRMLILNTIVSALPQILSTGAQIITTLIAGIAQALPVILDIGIQIITTIINAIVENLPTLISTGLTVLTTLIDGIVQALPAILDAGIQVLTALINGIIQALPQLIAMLPTIISTIVDFVNQNLSQILQAGLSILMAIINGLIQCLPQLVAMLPQIISAIIDFIGQNLTTIIDAGIKILLALINGLVNALPQLIAMLPQIISTVVNILSEHMPEIIDAGIKILIALISGLIQSIPQLIEAIPQIVSAIFDAFSKVNWSEIGDNIVAGIKKGFNNAWSSFKSWIGGKVDDVKGTFTSKDGFDIHSPSRVMYKIGGYVGEGFELGIGSTIDSISRQANALAAAAMPDISTGSYDMGVNYNPIGGNNTGSTGSNMDMLLAKMDDMTKAIASMQVLMDGKPVGKLVTPYVSSNLAFNSGRKGF